MLDMQEQLVGNQPTQPVLPTGEERRGVSSARGVPTTGQASTQEGANRQAQQNINATRGI